VDIAVVGAGAAGLMAAIQAGRTGSRRVVALDGAARLGAKIRISGGGRCNVTHDGVDEADFDGATRPAIRKVLRSFDVAETIAFFEALGVELKREETGKLFPVTNRAATVLDALVAAAGEAGVELRHPFRVEHVAAEGDGFTLSGPAGDIRARRVILATGGRSVPATGSDGWGYELVSRLGHTLTEHVVPALVPLLLPADHPLTTLRGISAPVVLEVRTPSGKRLAAVEGSMLLTHFGLSGPAVLDVSRHWILARLRDFGVRLQVRWLPDEAEDTLDARLCALGRTPVGDWLRQRLPSRLADVLAGLAGVDPTVRGDALPRTKRRALVSTLTALVLPVTGDRGWPYAEVTAGGVPLTEVRLETMESRVCPGLYLCGEILDVDGRIGGFNFQWAWASGAIAGRGAARPRPQEGATP
jgi:predicted Rossmann fold flavoprotein